MIERGPKTADKGHWIGYMSDPILTWWGEKMLSAINLTSCQSYVDWRIRQVSEQTARHELKTLRAAINYYHASEHGPLEAVPVVTLPAKAAARHDYFLTRKQAADRIRQARRKDKRWKHVARMILIGVYSGTRPGAMLRLYWMPSTVGGWFDLEREILYRAAPGAKQSKKRQPIARIHRRLLPHLKRWKRLDEAKGITSVIHYAGKPVQKLRNSWASVAKAAGHTKDGPHITRHTCATWLLQSGVDIYEAAGYVGMSPATMIEVYGHHSVAFQNNAAGYGPRNAPRTSERDGNESGGKTSRKQGNER